MSRVRILVTETSITKAGQVKHFQIKLSKHAFKIVGIETDVFLKSRSGKEVIAPLAMPEIKTLETLVSAREPRRKEGYYNVAGKLKLQSMEKENIFFSDWVKASIFYEEFKQPKAFEIHSGLKDIRGKTAPKKVDVPVESTIINALYHDNIGKFYKQDLSYTLKVFVWMEVNEQQNGVAFEFLTNEKESTEK
ncbi:MAG: hypothetical protein JNJ41_03340 [Bacteroidia bacterium]|nr:hypothetical protein [Bacteroidia bacterium]